jgi:hypothetical protein
VASKQWRLLLRRSLVDGALRWALLNPCTLPIKQLRKWRKIRKKKKPKKPNSQSKIKKKKKKNKSLVKRALKSQ